MEQWRFEIDVCSEEVQWARIKERLEVRQVFVFILLMSLGLVYLPYSLLSSSELRAHWSAFENRVLSTIYAGIMVGNNIYSLLSCSSFSSSPVVSTRFISVLHKLKCSNKRVDFSFFPWFLIPFALEARKELPSFSAEKNLLREPKRQDDSSGLQNKGCTR